MSPEPYGMNTSFHVGDEAERVKGNRKIFLDALGIAPDHLAIPEQRHTAVVRNACTKGTYEECDALMTDVPGVFLSVSVADCAPVFLFDRSKKVVACVHAGWRGTAHHIVENTIHSMREEFGSDPGSVVGFIGPSAGPCCYEVGTEVAGQFDPEFVVRRSGTLYLDIRRANQAQFSHSGVPPESVEVLNDCTICKTEIYHSFRRDRQNSGRMMGVIGLNQ